MVFTVHGRWQSGVLTSVMWSERPVVAVGLWCGQVYQRTQFLEAENIQVLVLYVSFKYHLTYFWFVRENCRCSHQISSYSVAAEEV